MCSFLSFINAHFKAHKTDYGVALAADAVFRKSHEWGGGRKVGRKMETSARVLSPDKNGRRKSWKLARGRAAKCEGPTTLRVGGCVNVEGGAGICAGAVFALCVRPFAYERSAFCMWLFARESADLAVENGGKGLEKCRPRWGGGRWQFSGEFLVCMFSFAKSTCYSLWS